MQENSNRQPVQVRLSPQELAAVRVGLAEIERGDTLSEDDVQELIRAASQEWITKRPDKTA